MATHSSPSAGRAVAQKTFLPNPLFARRPASFLFPFFFLEQTDCADVKDGKKDVLKILCFLPVLPAEEEGNNYYFEMCR
jgi:hypothetical protein